MATRTNSSINEYIVKMRCKENAGLFRIHKWLSGWESYQMLDEMVALAHILNVLDKNNLAVSRTEVRNCFNKFYKKEYHGEKKTYLSWLYTEFNIKKGAITNSNRSHRVISEGNKARNPPIPEIEPVSKGKVLGGRQ